MKRSQINDLLRQAKELFREHCFLLPPFAEWTAAQWLTAGPEADEIRRCGLGWDLTDFGGGDFARVGLLLFTLRNGRASDPAGKRYAEKIMIVGPGQVTPWHYHEAKMEDIINRGGGRLCIQVSNVGPDNRRTDTPVSVALDGVRRTVPAGTTLVLDPGASITITRRLAHQFWGHPDGGQVLAGEVSDVNDDHTDNYFLTPVGRFPEIEEDEEPLHWLCHEYRKTPCLVP